MQVSDRSGAPSLMKLTPLHVLLLLSATLHLGLTLVNTGESAALLRAVDAVFLVVIAASFGLAVQGWLAERRRPQSQRGLGSFVVSMLLLLLAETWTLKYDLPGRVMPDISLADPLYLLSYLGIARTLLRLSGLRGWSVGAAVNLLDSLTVMIVVGEVAWLRFLAAALAEPGTSALMRGVNLTYVALDLLVLGLALLALRRRFSPPLLLFGAGMFAFVMADFQYFALGMEGTYRAGTPLDSLWAWGTAAQACGLVWAWQTRSWSLPRTPAETLQAARQDRVLALLPYLAMIVSGFLLLRSGVSPQFPHKQIEIWTVALFVVVMLRQAFAGWESARLNKQLARQAQELHHLAFHDALTGLHNRAAFEDELGQRLTAPRPQPLALLYLDLNNFKPVNDTLGHAAGDQALAQVAQRLRDALPAGTFVARLGGDEFAVLLGAIPDEDAAWAAEEQIRAALERPMQVGEHVVHLSAAVGVTLAPAGEAVVPEILWREADQAMYRVKHSASDVEALPS